MKSNRFIPVHLPILTFIAISLATPTGAVAKTPKWLKRINRTVIDAGKTIEKGIQNGGKTIEDVAHGAGDLADQIGRDIGDATRGAADAAADVVTAGGHGRKRDEEKARDKKAQEEAAAAAAEKHAQELAAKNKEFVEAKLQHNRDLETLASVLSTGINYVGKFKDQVYQQIEFLQLTKRETERTTTDLSLLQSAYEEILAQLQSETKDPAGIDDPNHTPGYQQALKSTVDELGGSILNNQTRLRDILSRLNVTELRDLYEQAEIKLIELTQLRPSIETRIEQNKQEIAAHGG
ncbi:MAG: hypothetical protein H6624_09425 [Bdellovibrionaceae bacterium]|nr:hypothetical protein [Bdellovibrionales bacterium]MCB9084555.1 hypothetical protein [Pseudobdellovibrionaceae bacterium]